MRYLFILTILFIGFSFTSHSVYAQKGSFSNLTEKNGKIGIGTKNPDALLTVKGDIHAQEVLVDLKGAVAPDYVFEDYFLGKSESNPAYRRWTLSETEAYLAKHMHLPGVPSAKDLEENGMNLMKQHLVLLEKIEELTLHLIDQQKEMESLKKELQELTN